MPDIDDRDFSLFGTVNDTPWAVMPEALAKIQDGLLDIRRDAEKIEGAVAASRRSRIGRVRSGSVAVVPLVGLIAHRPSIVDMLFGTTSIGMFRADFAEAVADPGVGAVVLLIDSPGGSVSGIPEAAAEIRAARGGAKPIVAVADTMAASAAYWLGSQADRFVVTPSGRVGSIGVYAMHQDVSEAMKTMGVKTTLVSAGRFKTEGNPFEPLTDEARARMQADVDMFHSMFVADVAAGRGVKPDAVLSGFGQGRTVLAREAVELGMVDRIDTLRNVLAGLGGNVPAPQGGVAEAQPSPEAECDALHAGEIDYRRRRLRLASTL
jgi:signal peptide peptidase SppA